MANKLYNELLTMHCYRAPIQCATHTTYTPFQLVPENERNVGGNTAKASVQIKFSINEDRKLNVRKD